MNAKELQKRMVSADPPTVVDVRTGFEFNAGHIPGALHAPTWRIFLRMAQLPRDWNTELVVLCEHGPRAKIASALLGRLGYRNITLLDGHMAGWRRSGLPVEK